MASSHQALLRRCTRCSSCLHHSSGWSQQLHFDQPRYLRYHHVRQWQMRHRQPRHGRSHPQPGGLGLEEHHVQVRAAVQEPHLRPAREQRGQAQLLSELGQRQTFDQGHGIQVPGHARVADQPVEPLAGYECWPFNHIDVDIVGYAVKDKSIMDWSDDSLGTIYEGILDDEGSPKCPDECYKHQGQAASADTSGCKGKPFDMSLWPSAKPGEGAIGTGGDWGQRVELNDMLNSMGQEQMMALLREMGHGFGLPEMYVDANKPSGYPACVMDETLDLRDGDGWLLRSILENIKDRYNF